MKCPVCGAWTEIVKMSHGPNGKAYLSRRRLCGNEHEFTTYEIAAHDLLDQPGLTARLRINPERTIREKEPS